jgi:cytochrome P450
MPTRKPPGPSCWWDLGYFKVRRVRRDPLAFYTRMRNTYGDIVYMRLGPFRDYTVFHPDLVKEVLVTKARQFHKMEWQRRVFAQWNGNSILLSEGDSWLRQRRLVQPAFHPRRFQRYGQDMVACTKRLAREWQHATQQGGCEIDVVKAMTDLTINIICKTMFDADVAGAARQLGEAVAALNDVAMYEMMHPIRLPRWIPTPYQRRKRWAMSVLDSSVRSFIRERRVTGADHGDLLSMLLLAVDEEGDGGGMSDEQVRDEAMTLLLAGHDTTAAGLSWLWYVLARHPEVEARVLEELEEVLDSRPPTVADVPKLCYTERVIKETLRMYPPAIGTFARQAVEDVEIGGYALRKGAVVRTLSYFLHHDRRWFPDPEKFDPERFAPGRVEEIPQYAYFPFGCGPRVCIGNTFAMAEIALILATLLPRFQLRPAHRQVEPELSVMLSLRPKGGLHMRVTERAGKLAGATA